MRKMHLKVQFIILIPLFFSLACSGGIEDTKDFGSPPSPGSCFCDPDGVETYLKWLQTEYPETTSLRSIGNSVDGKSIFVLEISDSPLSSEKEPSVLINGCIHGDEQIAAGICLKAAEYILKAYDYNTNPPNKGDDSTFTEAQLNQVSYLVENFRIHIMPALNPDGLAESERLNSNDVDLNRNFGYNWDEEERNNGSSPFDQAESAAVREDFRDHGYSLAINLHTATYTGNIGIYAPWDAIEYNEYDDDFISTYLPNHPIIESVGTEYSDTVSGHSYPFNQYFHYDEGGNWYIMNGSMADWAMGIQGSVSYTIELYGGQNYTTEDYFLLDATWEAHREAMLSLIKKAELGSGGVIINSSGGSPVKDAVISFEYPVPGAKTFVAEEYKSLAGNSAADGSFRFLTASGNYQITIAKSGFEVEIFNLEVDNTGLTSIAGGTPERFPSYTLTELE
jgi:hypothetical protein